MIKKLLSFFYMSLFLAGFGGISWFATTYYEMSSRLGYVLFLVGVVFLLTFKFFRRIFTLAKVKLTLALNPEVPVDGKEEGTLNLRRQWYSALHDLKKSKLGKKGDPTYVLPWYLVIGEPGSGKTTALTRARLSSPVKNVDQNAPIEPTKTWNWWFYDTSIMVDIAGRYCTPTDDEDVSKEWREILSLLEKSRRKESLNGIVVTVSASSLVSRSRDEITEEGRHLRRRIDELMRLFDSRIPVYVLITKCDQIYGFSDWANALPVDAFRQAVGFTNASAQIGKSSDLLDKAFDDIVDRIEDLRLVISRQSELNEAILTFPNELAKLKPALKSFFEGAFQETPYLDNPLIRGIYLSSAEQDDVDFPDFLEVGDTRQTKDRKTEGLFLKDLLGRLIPQDRYLVAPLGLLRRWYLATRNIGVASWIVFLIGTGLFLSLNFARQIDAVAMMKEHRPTNAVLEGDFSADLKTLLQYRQMIDWMQQNAPEPVLKSIPMNAHIYEFRKNLKDKFFNRFHEFVMNPLDLHIAQNARSFVASNNSEYRAGYIQFLVRRINILAAFKSGKSNAELKNMPLLTQSETLLSSLSGDKALADAPAGTAAAFSEAYIDYLIWAGADNRQLILETAVTQAALLTQMAVYSDDLDWLTDWAKTQPGVKPITLSDFWDGSIPSKASFPVIEAGFTGEGSKAIVGFIKELKLSTPATPEMLAKYESFIVWYRNSRLKAWASFLSEFQNGQELLDGRTEWDRTLANLGTSNGPFVRVMNRIVKDFSEVKDKEISERPPGWIKFARDYPTISDLAKESTGFIGSTLKTVKVLKESSKEIVEEVAVTKSIAAGGKVVQNQLDTAKAYGEYTALIDKVIEEGNDGMAQAAELAHNYFAFGTDPKVEKSLIAEAVESYSDFQKTLNYPKDIDVIFPVIKGPLDFAFTYANAQAACDVQAAWEDKVLTPVREAGANEELAKLIYGKNGLLWTFAESDAAAYLDRDKDSKYVVVEKDGYEAPISLILPTVLNSGVQFFKQRDAAKDVAVAELKSQTNTLTKLVNDLNDKIDSNKMVIKDLTKTISELTGKPYVFDITAQPISVNSEAVHFPFKMTTQFQCSDSTQILENYNFPNKKTISWSRKSCGDVSLKIYFPDYMIEKLYEGETGIPDFLNDFSDGEKLFSAEDFSAQSSLLTKDKITTISVAYSFAGLEPYKKDSEKKNLSVQKKTSAITELKKDTAQVSEAVDKRNKLKNWVAELIESKVRVHEDPIPDAVKKQIKLPSNISSCWPDQAVDINPKASGGENQSSVTKKSSAEVNSIK